MKIAKTSDRFKYFGVTAALVFAGYSGASFGLEVVAKLTGDKEVPPVSTTASGSARINVNPDMTVAGQVTTTGVAGTMAHIHQGPAGTNGPVVIPLTKDGEHNWTVPAGAKLNEAQYRSFQAGELYVNVHSEQNKGGEIRGQLNP